VHRNNDKNIIKNVENVIETLTSISRQRPPSTGKIGYKRY